MPPQTTRGATRPVNKATSGSSPSVEPEAGPNLSPKTPRGRGYVLPVLNIGVPESAVNASFWTAVVGAAVAGVVDPPLAALIGAGVIISRHRNSS